MRLAPWEPHIQGAGRPLGLSLASDLEQATQLFYISVSLFIKSRKPPQRCAGQEGAGSSVGVGGCVSLPPPCWEPHPVHPCQWVGS